MKPLRIAFIGGFNPGRAATASFNQGLLNALGQQSSKGELRPEIFIAPVWDTEKGKGWPYTGGHSIRPFHRRDYQEAVNYINCLGADVCLLQYDAGLFGGENGEYILPLARRLRTPLTVTIPHAPAHEGAPGLAAARELAGYAAHIVVWSEAGRKALINVCGVPEQKITVIEHGADHLSLSRRRELARKMNLGPRPTLLTFGLMSRAKGVETVIEALALLVKKYPDILYIVLGQTDPHVLESVGEVYRNYLKRLVEKYYLQEHVYFIDHYLTGEDLIAFLAAADICVTPYLDRERQVSGALSYALGAGMVAISTPFPQARVLLARNRGRIFDYGDEEQVAVILDQLLSNPLELEEMRKRSMRRAERFSWPATAKQYLQVLRQAAQIPAPVPVSDESLLNPTSLPGFTLRHLRRLTDSTGIIHSAGFITPDYHSGYTLYDNAMALLCVVMAYREKRSPEAAELIPIYLSLVSFLQTSDGTFRNRLTYSHCIPDDPSCETSRGAALWALGYLLRYCPGDACYARAAQIFWNALPHTDRLETLSGMALTSCGLYHYISGNPEDMAARETLERLTARIKSIYSAHRRPAWRWFRDIVEQPSGFYPLALLQAGEILGDTEAISMGLEAMEFLERVNFRFGFLSLIGDEQPYSPESEPARFVQRPAEALSMVLLSLQAFTVTGDPVYRHLMSTYFMWFLGDNDLSAPLYDFATGGCADGLEQNGVLKNQSAASIIAYLMAHLTVLSAHR